MPTQMTCGICHFEACNQYNWFRIDPSDIVCAQYIQIFLKLFIFFLLFWYTIVNDFRLAVSSHIDTYQFRPDENLEKKIVDRVVCLLRWHHIVMKKKEKQQQANKTHDCLWSAVGIAYSWVVFRNIYIFFLSFWNPRRRTYVVWPKCVCVTIAHRANK